MAISSGTKYEELSFLDGLRGLAALYVVVGHARWLLWEGYSEGFLKHPERYNVFNKTLMYVMSAFAFGHQAVLFFFILSGFVIHLRYARDLSFQGAKAEFDIKMYLFRRIRRIFPPLILALIVTYICDYTGKLLGFSIYSHQTQYYLINKNIGSSREWVTLVGNLTFLMNSYVPVWGSNGPLWSLKYEWWFYMAYPFFWILSKKSIFLSASIILCLYLLSFYPNLWPMKILQEIFSLMLSWWLGVLLADIYTGRINMKYHHIVLVSSLCIPLLFVKVIAPYYDIIWSIFFIGILSLGIFLQRKGLKLHFLLKLRKLGNMSYSLYVLHLPLLVLLSGWIMFRSPSHSLPSHFWFVLLGITIAIIFAFLSHYLVEIPFMSNKPKSVSANKFNY